MLMLISPAKKLDYDSDPLVVGNAEPRFLAQSQELIDLLAAMAPHQISSLMHLSDKLGSLNHDRYQAWQTPFTHSNARTALHAFKGDVYVGLGADKLSADELDFAQKHLRILSGLYGLLRPLDLMQAYRLEMGTKLANAKGKNLYAFWGDTISAAIKHDLAASGGDKIINLASNEYYKAAKSIEKTVTVINPIFKDKKNGHYKIISFYAKKARGLMVAYAIKHRITDAEHLKDFDSEGYRYAPDMSSANDWVFVREQEA